MSIRSMALDPSWTDQTRHPLEVNARFTRALLREKTVLSHLKNVLVSVLVLVAWGFLATLAYGVAADDNTATSEQTLRECIEYQLFFKTLEVPPNPSTEDYKEQKAGFEALGLDVRDAKLLGDILATFRDRYNELDQSFEKSSKHDTASAIAFSKEVDALVEAIKADLKKSLSPRAVKSIESVITRDEELKRRADQYVRWRGLREMQANNESKSNGTESSGHN